MTTTAVPTTGPPPVAPPAGEILALEGVTLDRANGDTVVRALDAVDLTVHAGELVVLMGPSGSGKSSVIDVACGLVDPTVGVVRVEGLPVMGRSHKAWRRLRRHTIGVVHQRLDLMPGLDVVDNVALPLLLEHERVGRAHERAGVALDRVGLGDHARRSIDTLSGGQRQRVAIARAIVGERRLVLADEPTAAVDTVTAEAIVELLARLAGDGVAVLMATHDSRLAGWADRVISLRDGRVVGARPAPTEVSR